MNLIRYIPVIGLTVVIAHAAAPEAYLKRWNDPALNSRIDRNIEQYRKGDATIEVVDAAGKPLNGAKVDVRQTGHEFLFGSNAFVLGQLGTPERNRAYEEAFAKLFNFATVPFYWEGTEPVQGELRYAEGSRDIWRRPPPDRFLPWAKKYGITLKGHPLLWHQHNPTWLPTDPDVVRGLYQKRFREIASRYAGKIKIFDVVNESHSAYLFKTFPLYAPDRAYVAWAWREVAPLFPPDTVLMINETGRFNAVPAAESAYFAQIKALLAEGLPIRGVGFQMHLFRRERLDTAMLQVDPAKTLSAYEEYGVFNLPLYISEVTIPSAGDDGEALQAEVTRNYYRLWFSVPRMAGITWWNLGDATAVEGENEAKGGLVDENLKPKASYRALDQLINQEWKTRALAETRADGVAHFRGFFGKYEVTVTKGDVKKTFTIEHTAAADSHHQITL